MENKVLQQTYRRKGPDIIIKMIDIGSVILWGFLIINVVIILFAKPEGETFFDRLFGIDVRGYWDAALLQVALILSLAQLATSIVSLCLNSRRLKRKGDKIRVSIIISIFAALLICMFLTIFLYLT